MAMQKRKKELQAGKSMYDFFGVSNNWVLPLTNKMPRYEPKQSKWGVMKDQEWRRADGNSS
jgi:hypothetical protein